MENKIFSLLFIISGILVIIYPDRISQHYITIVVGGLVVLEGIKILYNKEI